MSKISFWNSVKENAKRRIWVAVLAVIVLAIFYPLVCAMIMQIEGMDIDVSYRFTNDNEVKIEKPSNVKTLKQMADYLNEHSDVMQKIVFGLIKSQY